jgi:hypothetical protein
MAKSKSSFNKKQIADGKKKKKKEKLEKRMEKRSVAPESNWENMIAYVDADGNLSDTPPVVPEPKKPKKP